MCNVNALPFGLRLNHLMVQWSVRHHTPARGPWTAVHGWVHFIPPRRGAWRHSSALTAFCHDHVIYWPGFFGAFSKSPITAATRQATPAMINGVFQGSALTAPLSAAAFAASLKYPATCGPAMPATP